MAGSCTTKLGRTILGAPRFGETPRPARRHGARGIALIVGLLFVGIASAREVIPPAPAHYFNDFAGVVPAGTQAQLENQLTQFERDTSNQIVVAIYPMMASDSSIEDY